MAGTGKKLKAGVIGCGNISDAYFEHACEFEAMEIVACADLEIERAKEKAEQWKLQACSVQEMLADKAIDIIINLTTPQAHTEIALAALDAGKHVHTEKPLAVELEDGKKIAETAKKKGLLYSCAPDTFLGGGQQTCRKLIDDGWIGRPTSATAFMMCAGHESWHPAPAFYYLNGGGPMFDMGPYYLTALINLLGPVKRVAAINGRALEERTCTSKECMGEKLPVEIDTHVAGTIEFVNGAIATVITSFDTHLAAHAPIEIHGTKGSMQVPDPNCFRGPVRLNQGDQWQEVPIPFGYCENSRSIGAADLALAVTQKRDPRCGPISLHVLEVMHAFVSSSTEGRYIEVESTCQRPEPLQTGLLAGQIK